MVWVESKASAIRVSGAHPAIEERLHRKPRENEWGRQQQCGIVEPHPPRGGLVLESIKSVFRRLDSLRHAEASVASPRNVKLPRVGADFCRQRDRKRLGFAGMIRPVFILGNKRSGTSQLVRMLNLHPRVFISHESDIIWALFQFVRNEPFESHPWDSGVGLQHTLKSCGSLLRHEQSPRNNFLAVQQRLMEMGTPFLPPQQKSGLLWIGDKKPFQHTDPQLLDFILEHFDDARFLHIVRHPFAVAESSARFNETRHGDFWLGLTLEEKVERWTFHERQVLTFRENQPGRVHSLRYEDFCERTAEELARVFQFLKLPECPEALLEAARQTRWAARKLPVIRCSPETRRIAAGYHYDLESPVTPLQAIGRNLARRLRRPVAS